MRGKWVLASAVALALVAPRAEAQSKSGGFAIIPFVGYAIPGTLAEDNTADIHLTPKGAMILGAQVELGLSKNIGIDLGVNRSFSQKIDIESGGAVQGTDDFTMTQFTGSLVFRPAGRRPNGGVTPLFIEVGGGATMYEIGSAAFPAADFNHTSFMGFAGVGYNIAIGPRGTIQIFGRAQYIDAYTSQGLDDFNALPPVTNIAGSGMLNFQVGAGFRYGR